MIIQCPNCKNNVNVSDNAQNAIVCPYCLTIIREAATPPSPPRPRITPNIVIDKPEETVVSESQGAVFSPPVMPEMPVSNDPSMPTELPAMPEPSETIDIEYDTPPPPPSSRYAASVPEPEQPSAPIYYAEHEPERKNNASIWWIILGVLAAALIVGIILILSSNKNNNDYDSSPEENDTEYTENVSEVSPVEDIEAEEVADAAEEAKEAATELDHYILPNLSDHNYAQTFYDELKTGNFVNTWNNIRRSDFSGIKAKSESSIQITAEDNNGFRYQFYFLGDDDRLTGVAVSHASEVPSTPCSSLDYMINNDSYFTWVGPNQYELPNGCLVSPGYTATRFYIYYYMPNAPEKDAAPRRE
ncbi:MAG: hypothetical protein IK092_03555 [Muribaculaceae bacterium]|nr:hypothetical protein [Muribaculaceae bacterium]